MDYFQAFLTYYEGVIKFVIPLYFFNLCFRFDFEQTGEVSIWTKKVTVVASNAISSFTVFKELKFVAEIRNFSLVPNRQNVTTNETFYVSMEVRVIPRHTRFFL